MNGFRVEPGERLASTPFTCPSISSSLKLADPTNAFTCMVSVSSRMAEALRMPLSRYCSMRCAMARSIAFCIFRSMLEKISPWRSFSNCVTTCGARNGNAVATFGAMPCLAPRRSSSGFAASHIAAMRVRASTVAGDMTLLPPRAAGFCGITASVKASGSVRATARF